MNVEALLSLADLIEDTGRFDLSTAGRTASGLSADALTLWNDCGSVGCVMGWENARHDRDPWREAAARESLGLTYQEADRLFYDFNWWYWACGAFSPTAAQAADVLRRIARGELKL